MLLVAAKLQLVNANMCGGDLSGLGPRLFFSWGGGFLKKKKKGGPPFPGDFKKSPGKNQKWGEKPGKKKIPGKKKNPRVKKSPRGFFFFSPFKKGGGLKKKTPLF